MSLALRYFEWQARLVVPHLGRRVVEVGSGTGNFTAHLLNRDLVISLDIEPACIERLNNRFPNRAGLHTLVTSPGAVEFAALARFEPDSCVCLNVLEHIEDDAAALRAMAAILTPAGVIVLIIPAFPALYGPIDRNAGHFRRYTRRTLSAAAQAAGLRVRSLRYLNAPGFFAWWLNARILRRERQSAAQIRLFDRRLVPVISCIESVIPPPFGQSILAILEKPNSCDA
jgi:SAM-dependent methyltransferase